MVDRCPKLLIENRYVALSSSVSAGRWASLTTREREVIASGFGLLNKQVGYKLGISEITVKAHNGKAMLKMEADSLADLVRMAARLGLAPSKNPWQVLRESDES